MSVVANVALYRSGNHHRNQSGRYYDEYNKEHEERARIVRKLCDAGVELEQASQQIRKLEADLSQAHTRILAALRPAPRRPPGADEVGGTGESFAP